MLWPLTSKQENEWIHKHISSTHSTYGLERAYLIISIYVSSLFFSFCTFQFFLNYKYFMAYLRPILKAFKYFSTWNCTLSVECFVSELNVSWNCG